MLSSQGLPADPFDDAFGRLRSRSSSIKVVVEMVEIVSGGGPGRLILWRR